MQLPNDDVTQDDLYYLALFLKRCGYDDFMKLAEDKEEAEKIRDAVGKFEKALAGIGIEPR